MRCWLAFIFLLPFFADGQTRCATETLDVNLHRSESYEAFSQWIDKKQQIRAAQRTVFDHQQEIYEVPVVFHIIHNGEAVGSGKNLSDQRVHEQLEIINQDYRRENPDASNTPAMFLPVAADTEINFVLAKQDPEGAPTTGITRTEVEKTSFTDDDKALITSYVHWPPEDYINIYVLNTPEALGFAVFPFSDLGGIASETKNIRQIEGVYISYKYFGLNDDSSLAFPSFGRTATHELAHYLGVFHVAHGSCSDGGDYCSDTPVQRKQTLNIDDCDDIPLNECDEEVRPMIENYMDYTDDECMNIFTLCQKNRMRTVLENSPRRKSLLTSHALEEPVIVANDLGIREIRTPLKSDCNANFIPALQVRNYGSNEITNFKINVTVNDSLVESTSFSNSIAPDLTSVVSFSFLSILSNESSRLMFEIVEVNGGIDGRSFNDKKEILLSPSESSIAPYKLNFEENNSIYGQTEIFTPSRWHVMTAPDSVALNQAAKLEFFNTQDNFGIKDMLLTNVLDLSSLTSAQLSFKYAYSGRSSQEYQDGLVVGISTDCGQTFDPEDYIFNSTGNNLMTTSSANNSFTPTSPSDWQEIDINITPFLQGDQMQIAFMGINGGGNNLYIDDIEITSANLPAFDLGIRRITNASVVTCREDLSPTLNIRNFGYKKVEKMTISVQANGAPRVDILSGLSINSGWSEDFRFTFEDLFPGENKFEFEILTINDSLDEFPGNNTFSYNVYVDNSRDTIPVKETFDNEDTEWIINEINGEPLFETINLSRRNGVLKAAAYDSGKVGSQSYFVSPFINTDDYKSGAIRFQFSYAQRAGYTDNLKILLSNNCGRSYDLEVFNQNSSDMANAISEDPWKPEDESDWVTKFVDISDHMAWNDLRIAFVFTNGQGNNLYLDDIEMLVSSDTTQFIPPQRSFVYPNPAEDFFYVAFDVPSKRTVNMKVVDLAGKTIIDHDYHNVLNQRFRVPSGGMKGFYVVIISGPGVRSVKRLYIR